MGGEYIKLVYHSSRCIIIQYPLGMLYLAIVLYFLCKLPLVVTVICFFVASDMQFMCANQFVA